MASISPTPINVQAQDSRGKQANFRAYILGDDGTRRALDAHAVQRLTPKIKEYIEALVHENSKEVNQALNSPGKTLQLTQQSISVITPGDDAPEIINITSDISRSILHSNNRHQGQLIDAVYPERAHLPTLDLFEQSSRSPRQSPVSLQDARMASDSDAESDVEPPPATPSHERRRVRRHRRPASSVLQEESPISSLERPASSTYLEFGFHDNEEQRSSEEDF